MFRILNDDERVTIYYGCFEGYSVGWDVDGESFTTLFLMLSDEHRLCTSFSGSTIRGVADNVHAMTDHFLSRFFEDFQQSSRRIGSGSREQANDPWRYTINWSLMQEAKLISVAETEGAIKGKTYCNHDS
jgi:hypothetical protein